MTLNLLWSDKDTSYLIVDSARTHSNTPKFPYSLLGQNQRLEEKSRSVEEGAQKIIPLNSCFVVALCGNAFDVIEYTKNLKSSLQCNNIYDLCQYMLTLPESARLEVSIAIAGMNSPFIVIRFPQREIFEVKRTHVHVTGSLSEVHKEFLIGKIQHYLTTWNSEIRLVVGLAYATTMAVNFNLTEDFIGGAFFGARLDTTNFHWQPDIVYIFYDRNFSAGLPVTSYYHERVDMSDVLNSDKRIDMVACLVRDNVSVAISSINGVRGVAAISEISVEDVEAWKAKWENELLPNVFTNPQYFVFIPKTFGRIAILPNKENQQHFQMESNRIFMSDILVQTLIEKTVEQKFEMKIISFSE